ncbi:MAG TPA: zinc-ribbon domain-containing protein [Bacteroidales bacterium]|nr:zinc-ribbon domain-containing protein [Bacteroidales bacterium]HPS16046.1 zinc-ribbon domain-containing protein [Bacteroidales bacterium]
MKKINLLIFSILYYTVSLFAQNHDGKYVMEMRFNNQDFTYSYESCFITINGNNARVDFRFKMTKPSTAATNYVMATGNGGGTANTNDFNASGNGKMQTFERGRMDDQFNLSFTMNGRFTQQADYFNLNGTFNMIDEGGENVSGTFSSKCPIPKKTSVAGSFGIFFIIGGVVLILFVIGLVLYFTLRKPKIKVYPTYPSQMPISPVNQQYNPQYPPQRPPVNQHMQRPPIQNTTPSSVQNTTPPPVSPAGLQFCTSCGAKLKPNARYCHNCSKPLI